MTAMTPAKAEWYAARSVRQLRTELADARRMLARALPHRGTSFSARIQCEANEKAIPMLEALIAERVA